ncbi:MAG: PA14 domain-containing protein [Candidatus Omnitrophota bacterium]
MTFKRGANNRGVALLMAIGVLGLLSLIGISFAINMMMARKEAVNYANAVKARYIAEAGVNKAVADIRGQVRTNTYGNLKNYISNYAATSGTNVAFGAGAYTLTISSEESKVNINTFDETDGSQITELQTFLSNQQIANIIDYRDGDSVNTTVGGTSGNIEGTAQCKNQPFDTIAELRVATGITQAVFDSNRHRVTVSKPIIRGGLLGKYYSELTGSSPNVLINKSSASFKEKIIELGQVYQTPDDAAMPGTDGDGGDVWAETHDAEMAGGSTIASVGDYGLSTFGVIWTGYIDILDTETGSPITFWIACDDGAKFYIDDILVCSRWTDKIASENYPWDRTASGTYTFLSAGWHRIRLEYYDQTFHNSVQLKWKNASFASAVPIPAERLGYDPRTEPLNGYNHAGIYTVSVTANMLKGGQVAAVKQVSAVVTVFRTWTQTTKEEFYAAWFGRLGNFRDGEVFNVNWLDNCPTEEDGWNAGAGRMQWDTTTYARTPDSVKLGYWDNIDEDPAYSAVMMKGYYANRSWWGCEPINISYQDFRDNDSDGDREVFLDTNTFEAKHFEVNRNYFRPNTQSVFVRVFVKEPAPSSRIAWRGTGTVYPLAFPPPTTPLYSGSSRRIYYYDKDGNDIRNADLNGVMEPEVYPVYDINGNPTYIYNPSRPASWTLESIPAPGTYIYWQPEAPFCGCWLFAKGVQDDTWPTGVGGETFTARGFKSLVTDSHGTGVVNTEPKPLYCFGDVSEIRMYSKMYYSQFNYSADKTLGMIGSDNGASTSYRAWINGSMGRLSTWTPTYPAANTTIFKYVANNQYLGWDWSDFDRGQCTIGPSDWDKAGAVTKMQTHWDNLRGIPESGYITSTPFYAGSFVKWGTVTWSPQTQPMANTAVTMYLRKTSTALPSADVSWTALANGAAISGTDPWIQYKAVLSTTNISRDQYAASSRTPVLADVTITYLPAIKIEYWREGL